MNLPKNNSAEEEGTEMASGASKRIRMILLDKEISQVEFAEMVGKPKQSLYNMLSRDTMSFSTVEEFADKLGCDVVFVDRETGKKY